MTDNLDVVIDNLGTAWLTRRLVQLIDEKHRELVDDLSDIDPLFRGNLFKSLRDAIQNKQVEQVNETLEQMVELEYKMSRGREIIREMRAILSAFPEVYG